MENHPNWFDASYIPWFSYDSLNVELPDGYLFFAPIINWGKYRGESGRLVMADGTFVSWLAFDEDKMIGTSGMSFVEKPPYFGCSSGKMGLSIMIISCNINCRSNSGFVRCAKTATEMREWILKYEQRNYVKRNEEVEM